MTATDADGTIDSIDVTDINPTLSGGSITSGSFTPANGSPATAPVTVSDQVPVGSYAVEITATNDDAAPQSGTCTLTVDVQLQAIAGIVINELLADPASDAPGDANGDGTRDGSQDEFVEIVNHTGSSLDLSGWKLSDGVAERHIFPGGSTVPDGNAIVIFGGGTPTGSFGGSTVQTASSGFIGLNNSGDTVTLADSFGTTQAELTYGTEGGNDESLTRDPDVTGDLPLIAHSTATGSGGALFSPGTRVDGSEFGATGEPAGDLFISEVVEGTSNNRAVEIFNITGTTVSLDPYVLERYSNGASTPTASLNLSDAAGTLADGDVLVIANEGSDSAILDVADIVNTVASFSGDDALALRKDGVLLDVFGIIGQDPGDEWGSGDATTMDHTLLRLAAVRQGNPNGFGNPSDITDEWEGLPLNTFDRLGNHVVEGGTGLNEPVIVDCGGPLETNSGTEAIHIVTASDSDGLVIGLSITGISPTPPTGSITADGFVAQVNGTPASLEITVSDDVFPGGYVVEITGTNDDTIPQTGSCSLTVNVLSDDVFRWVINEFFAAPTVDPSSDANGDGIGSPADDEFVEIVNTTGFEQDISGWSLSDSGATRHIFPAGTILDHDQAIVVFGGGSISGSFDGAITQLASSGALGLNDLGDTITFATDAEAVQAEVSYGTEGSPGQSLNLDPDLSGLDFVPHSTVATSGGALFSAGTRVDGFGFGFIFIEGDDLFFSEYIEGTGNNRAFEIYNGTGDAVDLSLYSVELYSNGSSNPSSTLTLSEVKPMLGNGDVLVIANRNADAAIRAQADETSDLGFFNGDDAIALRKNGDLIDVIGAIGTDPGSE